MVDGVQVEGTWRSHQVPLSGIGDDPEHLRMLEEWMRSYRPEELFGEDGAPVDDIRTQAPERRLRMGATPHANGGEILRALELADFRSYAVEVREPATTSSEATKVLGAFLRDAMRANPHTFRLFGPDETASNRLSAVFEATARTWVAAREPADDHLAPDGRVMEVLSEHLCQGWLEG